MKKLSRLGHLGWLVFCVGLLLTGLVACRLDVGPAPSSLGTPSDAPSSRWKDPHARIAPTAIPRNDAVKTIVQQAKDPSLSRGSIQSKTKPIITTKEPFVVHEWGTFTSLQGSDGKVQEGMQHEEEALPRFVHRRGDATKGVEDFLEHVTQKLETPVIYFYTQKEQKVRVEVKFPQGVISEWYPDAVRFLPSYFSVKTPKDGMMLWEGELKPGQAELPKVEPDSVWQPSREVAAAVPFYGSSTRAPQVEKFIFYRGVGRFDGAISITDQSCGVRCGTIAQNRGEEVPDSFLLWVKDGQGAVVRVGKLYAQSNAILTLPNDFKPMEEYLKEATTQLADSLIRTGLYKDEAWAMVNTWRHSYFQTPGLRMLYIVPRAQTDALLPIQITPQPTELVRTLVGRIEIFLSSEEKALIAKLRTAYEQKQTINLNDLGRFVDPRLHRVRQLIDSDRDENFKKYCDLLILQARWMP